MKKHASTFFLILILIIGLSLLLYPTFSDWWNSMHQSQVVKTYVDQVSVMDDDKYEQIWQAAEAHNRYLLDRENRYLLPEEKYEDYEALLNVGGTGIMGYVEIPELNMTLPVYHGTDEAVLQIAVGHLEWTSLPIGGESTHSVISGHRGLPSARLFTDLDKMSEGDLFMLRILDEVLTYEVDKILIIEPHEVQNLQIEEGKDLCTLVTCTPYGINSHRILVRGHRVDNVEESTTVRVTADAIQIDPLLIAPFLASPILLVLLVMLMIPKKKTNRSE